MRAEGRREEREREGGDEFTVSVSGEGRGEEGGERKGSDDHTRQTAADRGGFCLGDILLEVC